MRARRNIASIPARSAAETWATIVDLVKGVNSADTAQLDGAASIMQSLTSVGDPPALPAGESQISRKRVLRCP
jgi:hypothetical protein